MFTYSQLPTSHTELHLIPEVEVVEGKSVGTHGRIVPRAYVASKEAFHEGVRIRIKVNEMTE